MFLHEKKAFDRVWHEDLVYKLTILDISIAIMKIIESFLKDRTFQTEIEDNFSTAKHIHAGIL